MTLAILADHPAAVPDLALARVFARAVAAELRDIRAQLEVMAETLVSDSHFVNCYLDQLQTFDLLTQLSDECAHVLERVAGGMGIADAVGAIRLGIMQDRVGTAIARPPRDAQE